MGEYNSFLFFDKEVKTIHPTQKPVLLLEYLIKTYTNEGETVLDNCMGSGSTGEACLNTNRNFIGMELDEEYFNIAKERIKNLETNTVNANQIVNTIKAFANEFYQQKLNNTLLNIAEEKGIPYDGVVWKINDIYIMHGLRATRLDEELHVISVSVVSPTGLYDYNSYKNILEIHERIKTAFNFIKKHSLCL